MSLTRRFLYVGSRPDSRDTFFCLAKRKYPKKKPPRRRLFPALLRFERGFPKGLPSPYVKRAASLPRPCGQFRSNPPVLGATEGRKPILLLLFSRITLVTKLQLGYPDLENSSFLNIGSKSFQGSVPKLEFGNEKTGNSLNVVGFLPLMPRRAPGLSSGIARRGAAGMPHVFRRGWEAPSKNP